MSRNRKQISNYLGAFILACAMLYAITAVIWNDLRHEAPDLTTIRICHWQLESGFRESLQALIDDYEQYVFERTGEKVRIVQVPISERAYRQYVNTGLIGDMAPDIIEKGKAKTTEDPAYVARFFMPLGDAVGAPNPYNAGTDLESLDWKDTFFDGMQSAYDPQLLDYYYIPFSMFTVRIYYNAEMYEEITGRSEPPASYTEFMDACETISTYADGKGESVVPLAASRAQGAYFSYRYETPFLDGLARKCDMDYDGHSSVFESYFGMRRGLWNFRSPEFILSAKCMTEIASYFPHGWLAAQRDDALFMFAQERAVMLASGSWDAQSIIDQTKDSFEIGIFSFPMPVEHPEYGKYVKGPISEAASRGGIPWAINKKTANPDLCLDFLRFCTTAENNERFNSRITWLPVVRGVKISDQKLKAFRPIVHGYSARFDPKISTQVAMLSAGNKWSIYAGQMTPEENADQLQEMYDRTAEAGYLKKLDDLRRTSRNLERIVAAKIALREVWPDSAADMTEKLTQLDQTSQALHHNYYHYRSLFDRLEENGSN